MGEVSAPVCVHVADLPRVAVSYYRVLS
jgi:hypothetical protein